MRRSLLVFLVTLAGCELDKLPTAVGEHVVYHWDDDTYQLCGGTVTTLDRHIQVMTDHYGWSPSESTVEYFWSSDLARSACSKVDVYGCASRFSAWTIVFSDGPIDTHELGHTTRVGAPNVSRGYVNFIEEGFATRWHSAILQLTNASMTWDSFLSESELRAALDAGSSDDFRYGHAFTWWMALELEYGPEKMSEFVAEVEGARSADEVDGVLQRVFGVSLADSVALAEAMPAGAVDDPACEFEGLPSFRWTGDPLVVERNSAACEDEDIANVFGDHAIWLFAMEFPGTPTPIEVSVTGTGTSLVGKSLHMIRCSGEFQVIDLPPTYSSSAGPVGTYSGPWKLRGRYVGALQGPLAADGSVALPRVAYKGVQP